MIEQNNPVALAEFKPAPPDDSELNNSVRPETELSRTFVGLTRKLRQQYPIDKGVLVLRQDDGDRLSAISTWHDGSVRDGLKLNLPTETSLFEKVAEHGTVYTEEICGSFSGNFFERKLLLDDDSRCFVVQPLKSEGRVLGLLAYSSRRETAFAMFEEGALETVADKFGELIDKRLAEL
jgi:transcriptional regulator with GAF, ATPase, and Fis domain